MTVPTPLTRSRFARVLLLSGLLALVGFLALPASGWPATTQGMMVMPGEPSPAAAAPPVVTTPPAVSPPVPVTPVPAQPAPLISPPPPLGPPQGDKFNPPGGSYLYHQS